MRTLLKSCLLLLVILAAVFAAQSQVRRRAIQPTTPTFAPIAVADNYAVERGKTLTIAASGVLANDSDPQAKPLTAVLVSSTAHGTLTLNANGSFTYANDSSAATSDAFTYKASNGTSASSPATVTITINDAAPVAVADTFTLNSATAVAVVTAPGVLANDTLNNGAIASYGATTGTEQKSVGLGTPTARGGSIALNADGGFAYTPPSGFSGSDTFLYVIRNGSGSSTATVTINAPAQTTPDFTVNSPGFFFTISGLSGQNPALTLTRGRTYRFQVDTDDIHPFEITGAPAGSVTNNNISAGILTFTVPAAAQNYRYICSIHGFGNTITTVP